MDEHTRSNTSTYILLLSFSLVYVSTVGAIICPNLCHCDRRERSISCSDLSYIYDALPTKNVPSAVRTFELINQSLFIFDDSWSNMSLDLRDIRLINCSLENMSHNALRGFERLKILHLNLNMLHEVPFCIRNSSSIRDLRISHNVITSLSAETFSSLSELRILELADNLIPIIPDKLFWNLTELRVIDLSYNEIQWITQLTFVNQNKLTDLNLSFNQVTSLSFGWLDSLTKLWELRLGSMFSDRFTNITSEMNTTHLVQLSEGLEFLNLETLDISNNNLTEIPCHYWKTMKTLLHLYLNRNNFRTVPSFCFSDLEDLQDLSLNNSNIYHLEQFAFANMAHLRGLQLSDNAISYLPFDFLNGSKLVTNLFLAGNQLTSLPDQFLRHGMINRLDLHYNFIDNISEEAFVYLPRLVMLDLHGNLLTSLTTELKSAVSLQLLELTENRISFIDEDAFSNNTDLQVIMLDNNRLTTLSLETFLGLQYLEWLRLSGNRWYCDCRLKWMHTQIQDDMKLPNYQWLNKVFNSVRCTKPKRLKRVHMKNIKHPHKMICSSFTPLLTIKLIVGISISIVGLSTALYVFQLYSKARKLERNSRDPLKCFP